MDITVTLVAPQTLHGGGGLVVGQEDVKSAYVNCIWNKSKVESQVVKTDTVTLVTRSRIPKSIMGQ